MAQNISQDINLYGNSKTWANWMSTLSPTSCKFCIKQHGRILQIIIIQYSRDVNAHPNCQCIYVPMRTKAHGTATLLGKQGVDEYLVIYNRLPSNYITQTIASALGWKGSLGNLSTVSPGTTIGGDIYQNKEGKLPSAAGRVWYEADINYNGGYRNSERILYSNDGLIFVSYDHYKTFYEIT